TPVEDPANTPDVSATPSTTSSATTRASDLDEYGYPASYRAIPGPGVRQVPGATEFNTMVDPDPNAPLPPPNATPREIDWTSFGGVRGIPLPPPHM
ncbi:MAG: hypothetical protein J5601_06670, partial [Elusimicrobiaceae bacterium]|nr:hypothetical protein [Elusimicrobiaceae bacterium]